MTTSKVGVYAITTQAACPANGSVYTQHLLSRALEKLPIGLDLMRDRRSTSFDHAGDLGIGKTFIQTLLDGLSVEKIKSSVAFHSVLSF